MSNDFILAIAVVIIAVICYIISNHLAKIRTGKLKRIARLNGWQFFDTDIHNSIQNELHDFFLFNIGFSHKLFNIIQCDDGNSKFKIFEYNYTVGGGKHSHTYRQSIIYFHSLKNNLPRFNLTPENIADKISSVFGGQDIDFQSNKKFSSLYRLRGPDEDQIRKTFNEAIIDYFSNNKELYTEACDNKLIYYKRGKKVKLEEIHSFIEEGKKVSSLFV